MTTERKCDNCGKIYLAENKNLKRGWGLTCSKSCASQKREKSKFGYNPKKVEMNNIRRTLWNQKRTNFTSEGYEIRNGVAYNEYGEKMYNIGIGNYDIDDSEYWNGKDF